MIEIGPNLRELILDVTILLVGLCFLVFIYKLVTWK